MKKNKLSELSTEQLLKNEKTYKMMLITQLVSLALLIGVAIYITINKGFGIFTIFPLFFIPTTIPMLIGLGGVRKEIKTRGISKQS